MSSQSVQFKMALNSGRLVTSIISSGGRGGPNCSKQNSLSNLGLSSLQGDIYSPRHQASRVQCHFDLDTSRGQRFRAAILAGQLTSSMEPSGRHFSRSTYKLLPGDASVDSWFREIPVLRTWRVYLATGFDFREKNRTCFGSIGVPTLASVSYLVTIL